MKIFNRNCKCAFILLASIAFEPILCVMFVIINKFVKYLYFCFIVTLFQLIKDAYNDAQKICYQVHPLQELYNMLNFIDQSTLQKFKNQKQERKVYIDDC